MYKLFQLLLYRVRTELRQNDRLSNKMFESDSVIFYEITVNSLIGVKNWKPTRLLLLFSEIFFFGSENWEWKTLFTD